MDRSIAPTSCSEFLQLLIDHDVEFLVLGGYAVAIHGYPRATEDLDVLIGRSPANAERVAAALHEFGFSMATPDLFVADDRVVQLGLPPTRVDILSSADGIEFADIAQRVIVADLGGVEVPVISLADLRANKLASGRLKDLADLEELPDDHGHIR